MKSFYQTLVKFSCVLSFFGITACSTQPPLPSANGGMDPHQELAGRVRKKPELSVLFVGNSYSFGVPKAFSKLAAEHGKTVRVGHSTNSGWSLKIHAENNGTLKKIREGKWDIVVLQEHSEIPAMSAGKRAVAMFPPLRTLVTEVRQSGAIPVLYQTWGRRDGENGVWRDDFHAMSARLRVGYQAASKNAGGLVVVPVGDVWEREISAGRGDGLFMPDGSHPTSQGNALTAEAFYEAFFGK
ncbi:MAG: SGNH/GDSL hydrolase family protein [Luteolibacter sp.]